MKKSLILLPMLLLLVSCGPSDEPTTTSTSTSTTSITTTTTSPIEVNYGTLDAPLTVGKFLEEATKLNLANQEFSDKHFFVQGVAQSLFTWNESYNNYDKFQLGEDKTSETKIDVTGMQRGEGITDVYQNDTFIVEGLAEKYNNNLCLYFDKDAKDYPTVRKLVTRGKSTVTSTIENGTITGLNVEYENGTTVEFEVSANTGYKIDKVEVYGSALTASEGKYSFKVIGDAIVKATIIADAPASHLARYDFSVLTDNGVKLDTTTLKNAFTSSYKDGTAGNILSEVTLVENVYSGNGSGGANAGKTGLLKFGTSSKAGKFSIKLSQTISSVTLSYHDFYKVSESNPTTTNTFQVNDVVKPNPYNSTASPESILFNLTATTDTLTFTANGRSVLFSIIFN